MATLAVVFDWVATYMDIVENLECQEIGKGPQNPAIMAAILH